MVINSLQNLASFTFAHIPWILWFLTLSVTVSDDGLNALRWGIFGPFLLVSCWLVGSWFVSFCVSFAEWVFWFLASFRRAMEEFEFRLIWDIGEELFAGSQVLPVSDVFFPILCLNFIRANTSLFDNVRFLPWFSFFCWSHPHCFSSF